MTAPVITRDEAKLMLLAVAKQHANAGNAWQAASIVAAVDALSAPALGIDLEQFWKLSDSWLAQAERVRALAPDKSTGLWAAAKELRDLLALIDGQKAAPRGPDQPDLCDLCRVREEVRSDAEGIPFCQECWDGWQAEEAKAVQP